MEEKVLLCLIVVNKVSGRASRGPSRVHVCMCARRHQRINIDIDDDDDDDGPSPAISPTPLNVERHRQENSGQVDYNFRLSLLVSVKDLVRDNFWLD